MTKTVLKYQNLLLCRFGIRRKKSPSDENKKYYLKRKLWLKKETLRNISYEKYFVLQTVKWEKRVADLFCKPFSKDLKMG